MGAISGEELKKLENMQLVSGREEKILVLTRLRPLSGKEISANEVTDWECINDSTILYRNTLREGSTFPSAYTFDRVFAGDCSTNQLYDGGVKEIALSVVGGINSCIFAYGQTSSGKTYTITGITECAVSDIFDYIHRHEERAFVLKFSAIEIYNEAIRDLLSTGSIPLRLRDDPEKGTIVEKVREETLRDWNHLRELLSICEAQRRVGETSLNEKSSRSHQVIRLAIESSAREFLGKGNSTTLSASVNFVDLAGSERASQALSAGARLKEGCHINRSLLTLGTVIRKLSKGRHGHINYRDSKLTRILQSSLGGNARTAIVCTLSPARAHVEQTRNTLLFACCAKEVTTKAQVNVVMSDKALVKHLQKELARLESELRSPEPPPSTCEYPTLLRKKDLLIQKMEKEIRELTKQRDLAQSRVEDLLRMVGHEANFKTWENHEDGYTSDCTTSSQLVRYENVRSDSIDSLEKAAAQTSEYPDEYCKEVRCIETEGSSLDNNIESQGIHNHLQSTIDSPYSQNEEALTPNENDHRTIQSIRNHLQSSVVSLLSTHHNEVSPYSSSKDLSSSKTLKLSTTQSCRNNLTAGSSTPPESCERNFPGRPESFQRNCSPLKHYSDTANLSRDDSLSSLGSASTDNPRTHSIRASGNDDITSIHTFVAGLKEMAKHHVQVQAGVNTNKFDKDGKDVGLGSRHEVSEALPLVDWPQEFEKQQQAVIELWQACNVSLVHRTYFFLLFKGDPSDSIYMEVELRRLSFLKEKFSQGTQAVEDGQTPTSASSIRILRRERETLSKLLSKRFTGEDKTRLYEKWGISLDSKRRKLQLVNLLWTKTNDMNHVTDSADIVAKLIKLVEQGSALKEMFGLSFIPQRGRRRRSLSWKSSSSLF